MKLYKNKNVVAIFTALSLLSVPVISKAKENKLDAYYDDTSINIENNNSFTIKINKQKLEELINSKEEDTITVIIDDEEVIINKEKLINLKNKADEYDRENKKYTIAITLAGTLAIGTIILKEKVKQKTKN